ncbi:hypothetical protein HYX70_01340 [Candidatus Saccharibacteria bacterium]|nr:hypothetical protein [Candidatus Saccharibacteria bacterium]
MEWQDSIFALKSDHSFETPKEGKSVLACTTILSVLSQSQLPVAARFARQRILATKGVA